MNNLEQKLKELAAQEKATTPIPDIIHQRLMQTLQSLPSMKRERKCAKKILFGSTAAAILVGVTFGLGFISPTMAKALKQIPIFGSVFSTVGDYGLKTAEENGLTQTYHKRLNINGDTFELTEAFYDGYRINLGFVYRFKGKMDIATIPDFSFKIDNRLFMGGGGLSGGPIDDKTFNGILHLENIKRLPDQFTLNMTLKDKKDPKKFWQMNIPVKLMQSGQTTYTLNTTKSAPDFSYTIQKIIFSKSETILMIHPSKHPTPLNDDYIMDFMLMDDRGIVIDGSMGSGYFDENGSYVYRMYYSPLKRIPRSLTIIPYYPFKHTKKLHLPIPHIEAKMDHSPTPEKPILLSMGDAGKIRINKVEFHPDQTRVHYQIVSPEPYQFNRELELKDKTGRKYQICYVQVANPDTYSFIAYFPAIKPDQLASFVTRDLAPHVMRKDLMLKVELPPKK